MRWIRSWLVLPLLCAAVSSAAAQTDPATTRPLFTWRDAVLAGGFVVTTIAIRPLDKSAEQALQQPERQKNKAFREAAIGFRTIAAPGSVIIGLGMYATGRLSNNDHLAQLGLHGTEALFLGEGVGTLLKDIFGRARPFVDTNPDNFQLMRGFKGDDKFRSFPSGHAVAGFAAAAAVSAETSRWWPNTTLIIGPAMYGGAALIGLSRMYDNRHWASDVILGAAIGTFAGTKVVRYYHEHPGNKLDKWLLNASVSPGDLSHISFSVLPALGRR
ncbi:MAG: phosphoesterase PA-phosphatase related protein [Gemmatimonadetes bacterium]|nr:phosphoesterase PA-phosphatase related protein [Gemmatimonadota bacterium]